MNNSWTVFTWNGSQGQKEDTCFPFISLLFFFFNQDIAALQCCVSFCHTLKWISYVICRDVDGPKDTHTEWIKLEREKQTLYIYAYLEKWFRWTYLQGRNRNTDGENGCMDTGGSEREWTGTLGLAYNLTPDCLQISLLEDTPLHPRRWTFATRGWAETIRAGFSSHHLS